MRDAVAAATRSIPSRRDWLGLSWKTTAWAVLLGSIIYYVRRDALHYLFHYTPESFKGFWSDRILIRTHVACAIIMIFTGPFQFWTGFRMRYLTLNTWLGRIFLVTGTFVASSAMYLGLHPRTGGIVMGIGLSLNGLFWLAAAAMAYYAIRLRNIPQHKEWMIRTYVLACNGIVGESDTRQHTHFGSANRHRRCQRFEWMATLGGSANDRRGHYPASSPAKNAPPDQGNLSRLDREGENHPVKKRQSRRMPERSRLGRIDAALSSPTIFPFSVGTTRS